MKTIIYFLLIGFISATLWVSCGGAHDDIMLNEDKIIEQFISNLKNNGTVMATTSANGVTRAIISRGAALEPVQQGDSVYFNFVAYIMKSSVLTSAVVYETNIKSEAKKAGIDTLIRDFTPLGEIAGNGKLITGLDKGLQMCYLNEQCYLIFNSDLGYGSQAMGIIPPNSPIFWYVKIVRIKKK